MAYKKQKKDRPAPTRTLPRIWDMLVNHFFQLLWANFLCAICMLPIVTIPASLCGLYAVVQQYYRKGYGDVNGTFFKEFKQHFFPRLGIFALLVVLPFVGWSVGSLLGVSVAYVFCALLAVISLLTIAWLLPQFTMLTLRPVQALRNALLLTAIETVRNLWLLVVEVIFCGVLITFWPLSFLLFLFLVPVAPVIILNAMTEGVITQRIVQQEHDDISSDN